MPRKSEAGSAERLKMLKTFFLTTVALGCCIGLAGCEFANLVTSHERYTGYDWLFDRYDQVVLKSSTSAEVLSFIQTEDDFLSQSESFVVAWGEKRSGSILWFSAVAFDEELLTAKRKYSFVADERVEGYLVLPAQKLKLEAQVILDPKVLAEPYPNENTKRIAILKQFLKDYNDDMIQVTADGRTLLSGSMMARRPVNTVITLLEQNPAYAVNLDEPNGLAFNHMVLGQGQVRLVIIDDMANLSVVVGTSFFNRPRKL
ncbi:MAG: hypothetical protein ACYTFK_08675 [Planctomycetota bacterium]|jgi:hypothetical protein